MKRIFHTSRGGGERDRAVNNGQSGNATSSCRRKAPPFLFIQLSPQYNGISSLSRRLSPFTIARHQQSHPSPYHKPSGLTLSRTVAGRKLLTTVRCASHCIQLFLPTDLSSSRRSETNSFHLGQSWSRQLVSYPVCSRDASAIRVAVSTVTLPTCPRLPHMLASPALAMSEWNHKHGDADAWREPRGTGYTFPVQLAHPRHNVTGTMAPLSAGPNSGPRTSASSAQSLPNTVSSSFVVSAPTSLPLSASDPAESSFNDSAAHYGMATTTPPWYSNITNASSSSAAISHRTRDDLPPFHHDAAPNRSGSSVTAEQLALHQTGQQRFDTSSSYESLGPQHGASARYPSSSSLPIGHHTYYDDNTAASLSHLGASTFHHGSSAAPFHDPHAAMYHPGGSHGFSQGHQPHHSFSDFRGFPISSPFEVKHRRRTTQTQFKALEGTFKGAS